MNNLDYIGKPYFIKSRGGVQFTNHAQAPGFQPGGVEFMLIEAYKRYTILKMLNCTPLADVQAKF